jgi:hypothetical protein
MATQASSSVNILDMFCQDPVFGSIDRYLMKGGSWYEADQMYWRIIQKRAVEQLGEITDSKPSNKNKEKAASLLQQLKETTVQLLPKEDSMAVFQRADEVVKKWTPTKAAPKAKTASTNIFAAFGEESDEE